MSEQPPASSVAIVTGASRGIGFATAKALTELGWRVALVARSEQDLRQAAQSLKDSLIVPIDISTSDAAKVIVARTMEKFGRIDALVNNAGTAPMMPIAQTTDEVWRETIAINLSAPFYLSREVWPTFLRQGAGVIVNVSSISARDPFPGFIAYAAAKAGLNNLGLTLAREGSRNNIRVHTVAPAATETELFRSLPGMADFPVGATLDPADVAKVIVCCVTGDLAHTSGEVIHLHKTP